ncbi:ISAs1 family transposase [Kribbella catacumbae]|uniref:ISAs1 family transposase n=1 Tax=Kribbella catacumbae TaxID=460086 RepID=UPI0003A92F27|nr:ISAs1 family transposase [Kribbella catacumbae]
MSSSPTAAQLPAALADTCRSRLLDLFKTVPDPRARRGRRYDLASVLAVALAAVISGARSFVAIGEWAAQQPIETLRVLGVAGSAIPDESTIRRVFARLDADLLDQYLGAFIWTRTHTVGSRRVIALDGKTVRGARSKTATAPHLVAALDQATGAVIGQLAVTAKSNEIPAVQGLLKLFDLTDVVVTVDAMHTQTDTAQQITTAGGDYVFTVKANQPKLHKACKRLPWKDVPSHTTTSRGHGRKTTRTIKVTTAPAWVEFAGATQLAQVRRTVTRHGKKTIEVVYLITSANHQAAPPTTLAAWVQGHWSIENRLHWVRDVTYDEDRSQVRTGNAPQVMATLRNTAISLLRLTGVTNIAQRLRHHARNPETILNLLLTS